MSSTTSSLPDRHVLVSGGSGGIGAAVCDLLAARDVVPIVGYCNARTAAEEIAGRAHGLALPLDLTSDASIDAAVSTLTAPGIRLIGVVLAGSPPPALAVFGKISKDDMMLQLAVNVIGPQRLLAGLVRLSFRKMRQGSVVGVLSKAMGENGENATPGMGAYVIGKYGLAGVLAVLAASYPWLRVRCVRPGFTETAMLESFDERFIAMMREKAPFHTPQDVAASIVEQILGHGDVDGHVV